VRHTQSLTPNICNQALSKHGVVLNRCTRWVAIASGGTTNAAEYLSKKLVALLNTTSQFELELYVENTAASRAYAQAVASWQATLPNLANKPV
jgi:hypothetical protein